MRYITKLTLKGLRKLADNQVNITHMAIGGGGGADYAPTGLETALKEELYRSSVSEFTKNENKLTVKLIIPIDKGGFYIREAGAFDSEGDLILIANIPTRYKPLPTDGAPIELTISLTVEFPSANFTVNINSEAFATKAELNNYTLKGEAGGNGELNIKEVAGDYIISDTDDIIISTAAGALTLDTAKSKKRLTVKNNTTGNITIKGAAASAAVIKKGFIVYPTLCAFTDNTIIALQREIENGGAGTQIIEIPNKQFLISFPVGFQRLIQKTFNFKDFVTVHNVSDSRHAGIATVGDKIIVSHANKVFESTDNGVNFIQVAYSIPYNSSTCTGLIEFKGAIVATFFSTGLSTVDGIYSALDGDLNNLTKRHNGSLNSNNDYPRLFILNNKLYVCGFTSYNPVVLKSADGINFTPVTLPTGASNVPHLAYNTRGGFLFYMGNDFAIYKSADEGVNWTKIANGLNPNVASSAPFVAYGNNIMYALNRYSLDDGVTWQILTLPTVTGGNLLRLRGALYSDNLPLTDDKQITIDNQNQITLSAGTATTIAPIVRNNIIQQGYVRL